MPLTAPELGLALSPAHVGIHDSSIQMLAERISSQLITALASNVGQAFSYLRTEIHNRKLYVMFEQLLACDPKTDHEAPKDVYPIYSASIDTAELMIMERGMKDMRAQLQDGIREHFLEYIKVRDNLELQHDKMSGQIYSLTRRIGELTEILQVILAEKAMSTKRSQLKIHELNNIISGYIRSNTVSQNYDVDYTLLRDTSLLTQNRENEQFQREIESKNVTITALKNKMQLLSNQLTEAKARTRSILTRSFSRQSSDIHTTRPYPISAGSEQVDSAPYSTDQDFIGNTSMVLGLMNTPRGVQDSGKMLPENKPEVDVQLQHSANEQDGFIDPKRQSCVPPTFKFSSPILRKWQTERQSIKPINMGLVTLQSSKGFRSDSSPQCAEGQKSLEQFSVPPLQLDASSCVSDRRSAGEFILLRSNPPSSGNILTRASLLSPLIPHTMRELSMRIRSPVKEDTLFEKPALTPLDDLCDQKLSSCESEDSASFIMACENVSERKTSLVMSCGVNKNSTTSLRPCSRQSVDVSNKAIQTIGDDLVTVEQLWQTVDLALNLFAKGRIGSCSDITSCQSKAIQCSAETSECESYSFYPESIRTNPVLHRQEIRRILKENLIEKHALSQTRTAHNKHSRKNPGCEDFDDNLSDIYIEKVQYSSMLYEPLMVRPTKTSSRTTSSHAPSTRRAASGASLSSTSPRRLPIRSLSSTPKFRSVMSAWKTPRHLSTNPNERLSPRRSNNFLSARSPLHTIEHIQRSNTSASKLISKRPLPQFNTNGIVEVVVDSKPIKPISLKNGQ
ncbi:Hypothetical protein GLP15_3424 [Giardia lamblia P15]|uniref:Uncharacterized protein n=1 Tax=Giardia intestinalis (strain P15) TaxID=658858 RepID=E1F3K2_GIAIA|nr:Hypothetical protein GLP15_3424 [Giardia lamblia P15]